jgi:hypothetical protein
MLDDPRSRSKVWEALDRQIGESGKNRGQIVAHWEFQSTEAAGWEGLMKKLCEPRFPEKGVAGAQTAEVRGFRTKQITSNQEPRQIPVFVVLPPRLLLLDIAGPLEVLRQANRVQSAVRFDVRYVGPSSELLTSIGVTLAAIEPLPNKLPPAAWVVLAGDVENVMLPGGGTGSGKSQEDEADEEAIVFWLRQTIQPRPQADFDLYRRINGRTGRPSRWT